MSEEEAWIVRNDDDILRVKRFLDLLRPIQLTWLEAAVLLHHYYFGWPLDKVAEIVQRHVCEVKAAKFRLITKVATALGYIEAPKELGPITTERLRPFDKKAHELEERARKAAELRKQGLTWSEIAKRLGVTYGALWRYAKEHNIKMQ